MTPKEKAEELIGKFTKLDIEIGGQFDGYLTMKNHDAKQCALITIEQIKHFHESLFYVNEGSLFDQYLNEVIEHINNYEI